MKSRDRSKQSIKPVSISDVVKRSIAASTKNLLGEAYVSEPKKFKQVSESLSQYSKDAHDRLYKDYIKSLNEAVAKLDSVNKSNANSRHSDFRSLKLDETYNLNAKWLHELYFANCFDPHSEIHMDSVAYMKLQRDFGTFDDWQNEFMACAMAAGEGWVVCAYHMHLQKYVNTFISHHSGDVMVGLYPVVVVDMWSHSYYRDYLDDKKSYLISQMREINWNVVEERISKAEAIHQALS